MPTNSDTEDAAIVRALACDGHRLEARACGCDLELMQRGEGVVVRTLGELRALAARLRAIKDGMDETRKNLLGETRAAPAVAERKAGPSSWLAARATSRAK